jgi:protease inhibitor Inh
MTERLAARLVVSLLALTAGWALAGCSVGTLTGIISSDSSEPAPPASGAPRGGTSANVDMAGRWVLAARGGGNCGMNFTAPPGSREGTIAPEGNCPGKFFTSRRWALEANAVVIRNHAGEMLAQLNVAEPSRLEGQAATGEQVSLTR